MRLIPKHFLPAYVHVNASGGDTIIIAHTTSLEGAAPLAANIGDDIAFTFGGGVLHLFAKDGDERNLEQ